MRKLMPKLMAVIFTLCLSPAAGAAEPVMVTSEWLAEHRNDAGLVLVDMSSEDAQYSRFHIPGAVRIGYQELVTRRKKDKVSVRLPDERLAKLLGRAGISRDSYVVIYDDMGGLNAGRLFWELERLGHKRVSVLDGGLVRWILQGRKVDNLPVKPRAAKYEINGAKGRANEATFAAVKDLAENGEALIFDVRSEDEYRGHPRDPRGGHVPGARWWPWDGNVDFEKGFVAKEEGKIRGLLDQLGLKDAAKEVVLYCRTGHRAAQSYLTLRRLGFEKVRLYDGSMAEYGLQRGAKLVKGMAPR